MRLPLMVQQGSGFDSLAAEVDGEQLGHAEARMAADIKNRLAWLERQTVRQLHMLARLEKAAGERVACGRDPVHLARQRPRVLKVRATFTLYRQKGIPCGPGYQWPTRENRASPCQRQSGGGCL